MKLLLPLFLLFQSADREITGQWNLWIPGAVVYLEKDRDLYRTYSPGAPMNKLSIAADGTYTWGITKGKLRKVTPWYQQEGVTYYSLHDDKNNTYDFWYKKATDELIFLFGEVGGHAATASRTGKILSPKADTVPEKGVLPVVQTGEIPAAFKRGERVEIYWSGQWYKGSILAVRNKEYKVNYEGWGTLYDEWVSPDRLRKVK